MNYKLLIQPQAELDLLKAYRWYEERTQGLGLRSEFLRQTRLEAVAKPSLNSRYGTILLGLGNSSNLVPFSKALGKNQ